MQLDLLEKCLVLITLPRLKGQGLSDGRESFCLSLCLKYSIGMSFHLCLDRGFDFDA